MYAVVDIGGHQYQVTSQQTVVVTKLHGKAGDIVHLAPLLVVDGLVVKIAEEAATYRVSAKIMTHGKGEKVDIARFRAKSRYRKHRGFRPHTTTLLIERIEAKQAKEIPTRSSTVKQKVHVKSKLQPATK